MRPYDWLQITVVICNKDQQRSQRLVLEATGQTRFMLKAEITASNRQLQYERQSAFHKPYLRGTTCLLVMPVLSPQRCADEEVVVLLLHPIPKCLVKRSLESHRLHEAAHEALSTVSPRKFGSPYTNGGNLHRLSMFDSYHNCAEPPLAGSTKPPNAVSFAACRATAMPGTPLLKSKTAGCAGAAIGED